jgi:hypothetical protein
MAIDKEYWKEIFFEEKNFPEIKCPTCNKGFIKPLKDAFKSKETSESKQQHEHDDWEPEWIRYRFSAILECEHEKCKDIVVCTGTGSVEPDMEYNHLDETWQPIYRDFYSPKYFIPSLKIIPIRTTYPKELASELNNSFSHFFSDLTSCANKIRVCIEILMDELNVKKTELKGRKRKNLTLHARILEYKTQNPEVADYLLAINWIGNSGSHYDQLTKDDILDAYKLLDYTLSKLFDNQEKEIKKLSKEINKKKKLHYRKRER